MASFISKDFLKFLTVGIFFTITLFACRNNDLETYNPVLTAADERNLGNQLFQVILDNPSKYDYLAASDYPELYNYLKAIVRLVETRTEIRGFFNWDILVLKDDFSENIFILPGGKVVITTGLLKYLDGEYQLIALVGHEAYYADRENDGAPLSLSPTMKKVKDSFINNRNLGTKVFMDVIQGDLTMAEDIILECKEVNHDPTAVFEADSYAIRMICDNYLYTPVGLRTILEKAEGENKLDFQWMNNKPPSLVYSRPPEFTFNSRINHLESNELLCEGNEFESSEDFQEMIDLLPN